MRLVAMFFVALFLIDAALLGNIGSIIGAIVDPANMVDASSSGSATSSGTSSSSSSGNSSSGTQSSNPNAPNFVPPSGYHGSNF